MQLNIRKAAVLIASVDCQTADALLDQMPEAQAAQVRQAVMELTDAELDQADAVIADFLARRNPAGEAFPEPSPIDQRPADSPPVIHPFAVEQEQPSQWDRIQIPTLARRLSRERPPLIATVAVHLAPRRAADLLRHLPDDLQADVLRCVACHETPDTTLLREIEQQLSDELRSGQLAAAVSPCGLSAVQAILDSLDEPDREHLVSRLEAGHQELARQISEGRNSGPPTHPASFAMNQKAVASDRPTAPAEPRADGGADGGTPQVSRTASHGRLSSSTT